MQLLAVTSPFSHENDSIRVARVVPFLNLDSIKKEIKAVSVIIPFLWALCESGEGGKGVEPNIQEDYHTPTHKEKKFPNLDRIHSQITNKSLPFPKGPEV